MRVSSGVLAQALYFVVAVKFSRHVASLSLTASFSLDQLESVPCATRIQPQLWRLLTNFAFFGPPSFGWLLQMMMLCVALRACLSPAVDGGE